METPLYIGLVGRNGSGKTEVHTLLEQAFRDAGIATETVRFSDILVETLALWNLPDTRANLQTLGYIMNETFGSDTLANATKQRIAHLSAPVRIIDGVRRAPDEELLQAYPHHTLIAITAAPEVRFERMHKRKEKIGEDTLTYEQFLKEDDAPTEQLIDSLAKTAQHTIDNSGTREALVAQVQAIVAALTS